MLLKKECFWKRNASGKEKGNALEKMIAFGKEELLLEKECFWKREVL